MNPKRIVVIGNGGGGKSTFAAALANRYGLPWYEVDRLQFGPGWARVPEDDVRAEIVRVLAEPGWVLDGFGPYDTIVRRFELADQIVWVDHPLWVHYWWAMERQIAAAQGAERFGGPDGCDLRDVNRQMCEAIWYVHTELRPKILTELERHTHKLTIIHSPEELDEYVASLGNG